MRTGSRGSAAAALLAVAVVGLAACGSPPGAPPPGGAPPLVVTIDRVDPANQQPYPPANRLYEYNDFFSRDITVHRGDVVDFQAQPFTFHIVGLATDERAARAAYPVVQLDSGDAPAVGSGLPKIVFGSGNFPVTGGDVRGGGTVEFTRPKGPPVCGVTQFGQSPCTFGGGDDVEIIGPTPGWDDAQRPATLDQLVRIDAPPGRYVYFDVNHPGASGTLTVVDGGQPVTTQADADAAAAAALAENQDQATQLETRLNTEPSVTGSPGNRTFTITNGAGTPNGHVSVDAMLPALPITAVPGDKITFAWADENSFHTVGFAPSPSALPAPFGFDCGGGRYQPVPNVLNAAPPAPCLAPGSSFPQFIGDPGNAASGTELLAPDRVVDSGLLIGSGFGLSPVASSWTVRITDRTAPGTYRFFDAARPWASGSITVGKAEAR